MVSYWINATDVYRLLSCEEEYVNSMDSLLYYQDKMLEQAIIHTAFAAQRDYSEWQLSLSSVKNRQYRLLLVFLISCLLFLIILFYLYYRKKKLQVQLQLEKIQRYQLQIKQYEQDLADGLQRIKSSEIVCALGKMAITTGVPHVEWDILYSLFCEHLPLFEKALRELVSLSETEWRVCMLLKLGFPPGQIAVLMNKSAEGISSIRRRLYTKVFQKKGKSADWDVFIASI